MMLRNRSSKRHLAHDTERAAESLEHFASSTGVAAMRSQQGVDNTVLTTRGWQHASDSAQYAISLVLETL